MDHVSRSVTPKKQQPSSTIGCLRELTEADDDEDGLVFRKLKVASPSDETHVPQVKKVKPTPLVLPSPT